MQAALPAAGRSGGRPAGMTQGSRAARHANPAGTAIIVARSGRSPCRAAIGIWPGPGTPAERGPAARSGPEVDARLWVGCCGPELGHLAVADVADVGHRNLDRLIPARGRQPAQRHSVLVVGEHIVNIELERASCLLGQPAEEAEDLIPAAVIAAERPD